MSAGRRNGLSAADSNAERVNVRCSKRSAARSTASRTVAGGSASSPASSSSGRPPASARAVLRRAIAWRSRSAPSRCSSTWRRRSSRCARTASSSPSSASCAVEPVVGRLAGRGLGRRLLRLLAALGEPRLGVGGAGLGARDLGLEADRAARLLVALGLGRLAPAARRLGLAAQVLDPAQLALQCALAGVHVAGAALGLAQPREQRRVGHLGRGEEAVPRAEDLDDDVGVRPVLGLQPVLRARRLADEDDPAVEVREVVGLLDEQRDLAQPRVGLRASRPAALGLGAGGDVGRSGAVGRRAGPSDAPAAPDDAPAPASEAPPPGDPPFCSRRARLWLFFATGPSAVYAASASAAASRGSRRETTFETPSSPIDTPYRVSAASIVRFWCVTTMNWARSA